MTTRKEGYYIEKISNGLWQSVFPEEDADNSSKHETLDDALSYMVDECGVCQEIIVIPTMRTVQKATHTPGPWLVEPINGGETYQITDLLSKHFYIVAETLDGSPASLANAQLIAAAPEMLAALKDMLSVYLSSYREVRSKNLPPSPYEESCIEGRIKICQEAINKAEGK